MILIFSTSEMKRHRGLQLIRESMGLLVQNDDGVLEVVSSRLWDHGPITDEELHDLLKYHNQFLVHGWK